MRQRIQELAGVVRAKAPEMGDYRGLMIMENERDPYDPYFLVSLDLFVDGLVLPPQRRQAILGYPGAWEGSGKKDRFLMNDLPVRIEYRDVRDYQPLEQGDFASFVEDTYALRRLYAGTVLDDPRGDLGILRRSLDRLPPEFWTRATHLSLSHLEHSVEDMKSASLQKDSLHFSIARGRALEGMVRTLCNINRAFMPPPRNYQPVLEALPTSPEDFLAKLRTLLSWTAEPMERQAELASLLVQELVGLLPLEGRTSA